MSMEEVHAGIVLLDEYFDGEDWMSRIVDDVNIMNPNKCILAQLFGGFVKGCAALDIGTHEADQYGFDIPHTDDEMHDTYISEVEIAWHVALYDGRGE